MSQEDVLITLNEAIQINPNNAHNYMLRAEYYFKINDFDNAITDYAKASELEPDNPKYYLWLSKCYGQKGDFIKNQDYVQAALKYKPDDVEIAQWLDETMYGKQKKDNDELMAELQKMVDIGVRALQRGSKDLALAILTKALKFALDNDSIPDNVIGKVHYVRGVGFMENEEYDRAIDDFSNTILINPQNVDAYLQRAVCYASIDEREQTLADLEAALKIDPNHNDVLKYLKAFKGTD